jgi:hypothetical protein
MSASLLPTIRQLFSEHPRAARLSPEQIAGLLWILRYVPEPVEAFEVAGVLEVLDIERGAA